MTEIKPMKLEEYNAIVEDFNKLASFSREAENEIKKKYRSIAPCTLGSILSLLIQRSMKQSYRKSPSISSKYHELFDQIMRDKKKDNVILELSDSQGISPALFARSLLQGAYSDPAVAKKCFKDTTLIEDKDLAYQVFLAIMNDNQYGPYAEIIKQSIGLEYELRLERELRLMNITFSDENVLRARGYDKTPDFKLDVPIAVDGFIVNWIESKALFGDEENHSGYLKEQLLCYWNRFHSMMEKNTDVSNSHEERKRQIDNSSDDKKLEERNLKNREKAKRYREKKKNEVAAMHINGFSNYEEKKEKKKENKRIQKRLSDTEKRKRIKSL